MWKVTLENNTIAVYFANQEPTWNIEDRSIDMMQIDDTTNKERQTVLMPSIYDRVIIEEV